VFKRPPLAAAAAPVAFADTGGPGGPVDVDGVGGGEDILFEWVCECGCIDGDEGGGCEEVGKAGAGVGVTGCSCG
jgi:hypothetical protein